MTSYIRPGITWPMITAIEFKPTVQYFLDIMPAKIDGYEAFADRNPIWKERTQRRRHLTAAEAVALGVPVQSARPGVPYDVRKLTRAMRLRLHG